MFSIIKTYSTLNMKVERVKNMETFAYETSTFTNVLVLLIKQFYIENL